MNYYLNKAVWLCLNPAMLVALALIVALALSFRRQQSVRWLLLIISVCYWFSSSLVAVALLGLPLERKYLATAKVESLPMAEAIILLGGSVGKCEQMDYPDMFFSADRVWHAARLYKAGKAPIIVVSGANDLEAAVPLLLDFEVPRDAIVVDNESRNTYENSRFSERLLGGGKRVLLVTSAWHMSRALGNFSQTTLKVVPAACDFSATQAVRSATQAVDFIVPSSSNFELTGCLFKEWLGKLARK